jgi:hypothetical protein
MVNSGVNSNPPRLDPPPQAGGPPWPDGEPHVPLPVPVLRVLQRVCGCCTVTAGAFPVEATAATCYGPGVAALGAYLLARQHLPVARAAECLADCFGAPVSTGYLAGLLPDAAERLEQFLALARTELAGAQVAHFDETGRRVAAKLWWIHVMCTAGSRCITSPRGGGRRRWTPGCCRNSPGSRCTSGWPPADASRKPATACATRTTCANSPGSRN